MSSQPIPYGSITAVSCDRPWKRNMKTFLELHQTGTFLLTHSDQRCTRNAQDRSNHHHHGQYAGHKSVDSDRHHQASRYLGDRPSDRTISWCGWCTRL
ncbi:hypothetical protein BaRGS_00020667 [Batillaria attramentaria]|uniref:Uncharacterized protein n=1 Tax=Batillaria attramentaria TaxID=370345 RepID=A0ABD0KMD0_9CAEN